MSDIRYRNGCKPTITPRDCERKEWRIRRRIIKQSYRPDSLLLHRYRYLPPSRADDIRIKRQQKKESIQKYHQSKNTIPKPNPKIHPLFKSLETFCDHITSISNGNITVCNDYPPTVTDVPTANEGNIQIRHGRDQT